MRLATKLKEGIRGNAGISYNQMKVKIHDAAKEALGEQEVFKKTPLVLLYHPSKN